MLQPLLFATSKLPARLGLRELLSARRIAGALRLRMFQLNMRRLQTKIGARPRLRRFACPNVC